MKANGQQHYQNSRTPSQRAPISQLMDSATIPTTKGQTEAPNRFSYTDEEAQRILSKTELDNSYLSTPTPNMIKRKWENEQKKLI